MRMRDLFEKWGLTGLRVKTPMLDATWEPRDPDRDAAWDLYIELLTRITTQPLPDDAGDLKTALDSVYSIFPTTRAVLRDHGRGAVNFTKIAIVVLNQKVRPFTAKWHKIAEDGGLAARADEFRNELRGLQDVLRRYCGLLADLAGVEDMTDLEDAE